MLNNIQLLRALAAYGVVIFHLSWLNPHLLRPVGNVVVHGIDLFFVISGFIMVYIARRDEPTPGAFMRNRVIRIVPLYWALTIALFALALAGPGLLGAQRGDWGGLVKSLFFIGYLNTDGVVMPLVFPGWTLNYEMLFYALFAVSLLIRGMGARIAAVSGVLLVLVILGALLRVEDPVGRFYTSPRLLEFAMGMGLGLIHPRIKGSKGVGIAACAAGAAFITATELSWGGPWQPLAMGLGSALILYGALALEAGGIAIRNRFVLLLGAASYSLYLTHAFVMVPFTLVARKLGLTPVPAIWGVLVVELAVVTLVAILVHLWFERPVSAWLHRKIGDSGGDKRASGR